VRASGKRDGRGGDAVVCPLKGADARWWAVQKARGLPSDAGSGPERMEHAENRVKIETSLEGKKFACRFADGLGCILDNGLCRWTTVYTVCERGMMLRGSALDGVRGLLGLIGRGER
jgi:hypothetical protein